MECLASCATEIVLEVLRNCHSFADAAALTSTCRSLRAIWVANAAAILRDLGRETVTAFDYALIAVRAQRVVQRALEKGEQPPELGPIDRLGARRPDITEVAQVLELQHLVRTLEHMFLVCGSEHLTGGYGEPLFFDIAHYEPYGDQFCAKDDPSLKKGRARFHQKFHRATYKLFILTAALSWAYFNPVRDVAGTQQQVEEAIFGSAAQWIMDDSKKIAARERFAPQRPIRDDDGHIVGHEPDPEPGNIFARWELSTMLLLYEHMQVMFNPLHATTDAGEPLHAAATDTVTVRALLMGTFQLHDIDLPRRPQDIPARTPTSLRMRFIEPSRFPSDVSVIWSPPWEMYWGWNDSTPETLRFLAENGPISPGSDPDDGYHPPLHFFAFAARKHLNLRFKQDLFLQMREPPYYIDWIQEPDVWDLLGYKGQVLDDDEKRMRSYGGFIWESCDIVLEEH